MLFATGLLPGGRPREITDRLNDGTFGGVELAGGLAANEVS